MTSQNQHRLLLEGEEVAKDDEFLCLYQNGWLPMPRWAQGHPVALSLWGCVRRDTKTGDAK